MRRGIPAFPFSFSCSVFCTSSRAAAFDWDPVSDAEKNMTSNPLDPGSGAVVLFKRGRMDVQRRSASFWVTRIVTYTRIKILTVAGRDAANVELETPKFVRVTNVTGRTILPSGEIAPLDTSKVFHGVVYRSGKDFAVLSTSFALPSAEPGAVLEYQIEEDEDWFFPPAWIFDTPGLATLQSSLTTVVSPDVAMNMQPLETTANRLSAAQKVTSGGVQTDFAAQNLRPLRDEPFAVAFRDRALMVIFAPSAIYLSKQEIPIIKYWDDVAGEVNRRNVHGRKQEQQAGHEQSERAGRKAP